MTEKVEYRKDCVYHEACESHARVGYGEPVCPCVTYNDGKDDE
jgi:hypothetical protein